MVAEETLAIYADYKIENSPCTCWNTHLDIWEDYKDDNNFKYCPFCAKPLMRTIIVEKNKIVGGSLHPKK